MSSARVALAKWAANLHSYGIASFRFASSSDQSVDYLVACDHSIICALALDAPVRWLVAWFLTRQAARATSGAIETEATRNELTGAYQVNGHKDKDSLNWT